MAQVRNYGFQGIDVLKALLKSLPDEVEKNALRAGMKNGAELVAERAKALAPVSTNPGFDIEPGALRDFISVRAQKRGKKKGSLSYYVVSRPPLVYRGKKKIVPLDYGFWVEYGHMTRDGKTHIPARPYMRPAFEQSKDAVSNSVIQGVKDFIERKNRRDARAFDRAAATIAFASFFNSGGE